MRKVKVLKSGGFSGRQLVERVLFFACNFSSISLSFQSSFHVSLKVLLCYRESTIRLLRSMYPFFELDFRRVRLPRRFKWVCKLRLVFHQYKYPFQDEGFTTHVMRLSKWSFEGYPLRSPLLGVSAFLSILSFNNMLKFDELSRVL